MLDRTEPLGLSARPNSSRRRLAELLFAGPIAYTKQIAGILQQHQMNSVFISPDNWLGLILRLSLAVLVGGAIGWNREKAGKSAGLRTHMLVSLGAALFVLALLQSSSANAAADPLSRAIQGVATGIGFLGAGEILHESRQQSSNPRVKGLTSAAAVWVAAALGVVAGCGLWQVSLIGVLLTLLILSGTKRLERFTLNRQDDDS